MSTPRKILRYLVLLILLAVAALGIHAYRQLYVQNWFSVTTLPITDTPISIPTDLQGVNNRTTQARPHAANSDLFSVLEDLLNRLPAGTTIDQSRFDQALGVDAGNYLRSANVSRIEIHGDVFTATLSKPFEQSLNGQAEVRLSQIATFHYQKVTLAGGGNSIHITHISGVDVRVTWVLGWMPVKELDISHDTAGNTTVVVTVGTLFGNTNPYLHHWS